jgi:Protein of unknown function (DUF3303)
MLFMIIERFKDSDMIPIYQRVRDEGRMFPEGLKYIDSWVELNFNYNLTKMRTTFQIFIGCFGFVKGKRTVYNWF